VTGSIVIAPPEVVAVLAITRRELIKQAVEVGNGSRLKLDGCDPSRRSDNENRRRSIGEPGGRDSVRDDLGEITRVPLPGRPDRSPVGHHHRATIIKRRERREG
jgi:hypothetical protein